MGTFIHKIESRRAEKSGPDRRWTAAEIAAWPIFSPYAADGSAFLIDVDLLPPESFNASRPLRYTNRPGDDIPDFYPDLAGTPTRREGGLYLIERISNRILGPSKGVFHPDIVEDSITGLPCMVFGGGGAGENPLRQSDNGAIRPISRIDEAGAEVNNYSVFSADQAYSFAIKFRVPTIDTTVNGIFFDSTDATTGVESKPGGSFFGGASTTVDNNFDVFTHQVSGVFTIRNQTAVSGYIGLTDMRDGLVHTIIGGYDPVGNSYKVSVDGGAFDTQVSGTSNIGIIGTDAAALKLTLAGSGGNPLNLNNRFCGFQMFTAFIPSTLWLTDAAERAKIVTLMAEK